MKESRCCFRGIAGGFRPRKGESGTFVAMHNKSVRKKYSFQTNGDLKIGAVSQWRAMGYRYAVPEDA
jgi:hypothetical protein